MIVYGRNPVREALRGRRAVHEVWATAAAARLPWLAGVDVTLVDVRVGIGAPAPLVVALDQVTDPHNLGAVCRTAEVAGATGLVIPERRSVHVTPAVCKASAGAVEHLPVARVRNLADFLGTAKEAGCWCYGAAADATTAYDQPDYRGGVVLVLGAEGKGLRPRVAAACDALVALPVRGRVASLNVSAAAAALLYGILQRRAELDTAP